MRMEYALYNGLRAEARPGLKAVCEHCGSTVIAKCGSKIVWHWAHESAEACDSWHEPETAWHRSWKQLFGEPYSEIRVEKGDTYHIADVMNRKGIVFEFQNSSISAKEIIAREDFYGEKMIWVINGDAFKQKFEMEDDVFIQNWKLKVLDEFESARHYTAFHKGLIIEDWQVKQDAVRVLLNQSGFFHVPDTGIYYRPLSGVVNRQALEREVSEEVKALYDSRAIKQDVMKGEFRWSHPRRSWEEAKRPVFIDFGGDYLYKVSEGMGREQGKGVQIGKRRFIEKYSAESGS